MNWKIFKNACLINCELFKIGVFISLSASTKEELEELTEAIRSKGKKHQVVIDCLVRQQEKALDSVLPFGIYHFDNANGNNVNTYVLSDAAGILIPFSARSYFSDTGLCYGYEQAHQRYYCTWIELKR